jgi:hypothetical protein
VLAEGAFAAKRGAETKMAADAENFIPFRHALATTK